MRRRYGKKNKWGQRRWSRSSKRMKFAWAPLGAPAAPLLQLTAGTPEANAVILQGNSCQQAQTATVLDRSAGLDPLLERLIVKVVVIVVSAAIKKLVRVVFGLRIGPVDPNTQAVTGTQPSVTFGASLDRRQDWLYVDQRYVNTLGDTTIQYTLDTPWDLDFKPKRKFPRDTALIAHAYADCLDGGSLDATVKVRPTFQVGLLVPPV